MKVVRYILSVALGAVFIFSAFSKLYSIDGFEIEVYSFLNSHFLTSFVTKFLISLELFLGGMFVLNILGHKQWILKIGMLLIIGFTIFLIPQLITDPTKNCQCFGELLPMNPLQSVLKNLAILTVMVLLLPHKLELNTFLKQWSFPLTLLMIFSAFGAFVAQYILAKEEIIQIELKDRYSLRLGELKNKELYKNLPLQKQMMVAFFSATCPHCYETGKQLSQVKAKNPNFKFLTIINGDAKDYQKFLKETQLQKDVYNINGEDFKSRYGGDALPAIYMVRNDSTIAKVRMFGAYQIEEIIKWTR
ncbi:MAG: hypothetical protein U0V72_02505 [Cytophagales bacterium]